MLRLIIPALAAVALSACADVPNSELNPAPTAADAAPAAPSDAPSAMSARPVDVALIDGAWVSTDGTIVDLQGSTANVASGGLAPVPATTAIRATDGAALVDVTLEDGTRLTFTFDGEKLLDANGMPLARR